MISKGRKFTAFNPSKTTTGKTYFKVMDYDKRNPQQKNYMTVFCSNEIELNDRDKVVINEIQGVSLGRYKDQMTASMFASVSLDESVADTVNQELEAMKGSVIADISESDLPF